eukprot:jgi/Hompol1/5654/HPOL_004617-RA
MAQMQHIWGRLLSLNDPPLQLDLFDDFEYVVGRDEKVAHIVFSDVNCSKEHFRVFMMGGIPCIKDTSSNGTIVNGTKIHNKTAMRLAIDLTTFERVACKIIDLKRLQMNKNGRTDITASLAAIDKEVRVLKLVEHPNLVSIKGVIVTEDSRSVCIFLSRISGGELFDYIVKNDGVEESEAIFIFFQLLIAVKYLHDRNICHRDLKAENVLLESPKAYSRLLISDFGMAKALENSLEQMQTKCGTFTYLAPEILDSPGGYSKQVDCWALGVLLFTMIAGALPFGSDHDQVALIGRIRRAEYSFDAAPWQHVTPEAKDMVASLLRINPEERLTIDQALNHPWIINKRDVLDRLYRKMMRVAGFSNFEPELPPMPTYMAATANPRQVHMHGQQWEMNTD